MTYFKKHKWQRRLLWVVLILVFFKVGFWIHHKYNDIIPWQNSKPNYYLTVKGKIDPTLKNKVSIQFNDEFYTNNKACQHIDNIFDAMEGIRLRYKTQNHYKILPDAQGNFTLQIPIDRYANRRCHWEISNISYSIYYNGKDQTFESSFGFGIPSKFNRSYNYELKEYHKSQRKTQYTHTWKCNNHSCQKLETSDRLPDFNPIKHPILLNLKIKAVTETHKLDRFFVNCRMN